MSFPIVLSVCLIIIGGLISVRARDLVRLLIGLEVVFVGALTSIIPLISISIEIAYALVIITILVAIIEATFMIAVIYRLNRLKYITTTDVGVESE